MYQYNATLLNIIDGDTLDMDIDMGFNVRIKQRLRLIGINTPELNSKDQAAREEAFKAKQFVQASLTIGGSYVIKTHKGDKYGRLLAELYLTPSETLNDLLLQSKLAVLYPRA